MPSNTRQSAPSANGQTNGAPQAMQQQMQREAQQLQALMQSEQMQIARMTTMMLGAVQQMMPSPQETLQTIERMMNADDWEFGLEWTFEIEVEE